MNNLKRLCWSIITFCVVCVLHASLVHAQKEGGGLSQGVNDNNTVHESPFQTAIEVVTWLITIRILAFYKLP